MADVGGETGPGTGGMERWIGCGRKLVIGPADTDGASRVTATKIDIDPSILIASLRSETCHRNRWHSLPTYHSPVMSIANFLRYNSDHE